MYLLWTLIGCIAVFLLFRLFIVSYATMLTKRFVEDRHEDADVILETGFLPGRWLVIGRRRPRMRKRFTKRKAMKKLRAIISYFERTPMVADDEARATMLERLEAVSSAWQTASLAELRPPGLQDDPD